MTVRLRGRRFWHGKRICAYVAAAALLLGPGFTPRSARAAGEASVPQYYAYLAESGRRDAPGGISVQAAPGGMLALKEGGGAAFTADMPEAGYYNIRFRYRVPGDGLLGAEASLTVNGEQPYLELGRIAFPVYWQSQAKDFARDRFGNEIVPMQAKMEDWRYTFAEDTARLEPEPLRIWMNQGINRLELSMTSGSLELEAVELLSPQALPDYNQYLAENPGRNGEGTFITLEAEKPSYKNTTMVIPAYDADYDAVPYETYTRPLNVIDETTWILAGDGLYYEFDVPRDGYYKIAFKYKQTDKPNVRVFRSVSIDGKVPFAEVKSYGFDYRENWDVEALGGGDYLFYLTQGRHTLGIAADATRYRDVIHSLNEVDRKVNALYITLKKIIGSGADAQRDWNISEYFPTVTTDLADMIRTLGDEAAVLREMNGGHANSGQQAYIALAIKGLESLLSKPDKIPSKISQFTEGSGSVSQMIAKAVSDINMQAMALDQIYIYSPDKTAEYSPVSFGQSTWEWMKRFAASFSPPQNAGGEGALNVWVNRSRNYVEVLQRLADTGFMPATGIKVNITLMANEEKLTLAAVSGIAPDAALGVVAQTPYEMGIRGIATDLRRFPDFGAQIGKFSPGALLCLIGDECVYGLPETQDFNVTFYRKDILGELGIPVPETWDEVEQIMPELQRYGMNYYTPLATEASSKPISATAPFILQSGGALYKPDGMGTAIDDEPSIAGMRLMTDLSTVYGLSLQVPNFFESFRSGTTPIGISGFATYVEMMIAAPELMGNWAVAPAPGVRRADGTIDRRYPGLATASMIFSSSKKQDEAWRFLSWWMSTPVQTEYALEMKTVYGSEYLYNSANVEAFSRLPIRSADRGVILEQWKQLEEIQRIPGWYMVEREVSNAWNAAVFDGRKLRAQIDEAATSSNREILLRMQDFGYVRNGEMVRPYKLYTVEDIRRWASGN
jgi:ABC-type glycerol-3-phosphate transport system substrate-binding protein